MQMTRYLFCACALALLALVGAGRGKIQINDLPPEDNETHLGECPHDLADWLNKPRPELAKLAEEQETFVTTQRTSLPEQPPEKLLLPKLVTPLDVPVFRK